MESSSDQTLVGEEHCCEGDYFSGRLASDKRKSRENSCFPTRLKLSESANFSRIKPLNQVA